MEGTCTQNSLPRTLAKACFKFSSLAFIVATVFAKILKYFKIAPTPTRDQL